MELTKIYDAFNKGLFDGKLFDDIYTALAYSSQAEGLYLYGKWDDNLNQKSYDEILIDENLLNHSKEYWMAVLVHQMIHKWQHDYGSQKPPKHYHNKEYVEKAASLGLIIKSGYSNEQAIDPDGKFAQVARDIDDESILKPRNASSQLGEKSKNGIRLKYACPNCNGSVRGKTGMFLICGNCNKQMEPQE